VILGTLTCLAVTSSAKKNVQNLKQDVDEEDKNSSGDEIANVNFYAVRPVRYPNSLK